MSMNMVYTEHMKELQTYLASKLPEMPVHTAQEIAAHIANKTCILVNDLLREYENERRAEARRWERRYRQDERKCNTCDHAGLDMPQCKECGPANNYKWYSKKAGE